ncbi:MAG TPA: fumarylacetoacetate hydrolase family protein [Trueperaceae bacterium]
MLRVRYRSESGVHWGQLDGGRIRRLAGLLGQPTGESDMLSDVTLLAPCEPRSIVCAGLNYRDHAAEMGLAPGDLPAQPGIFLKGLNSLNGPGDPIPYPSWTDELHFEGELAVVIGREMNATPIERALDHVLGYTCACDVTARDKQRTDLQWARAKSADGFCPVGPWLAVDIDPGALRLQTKVNGELRQDSNTCELIFSVPELLSFISHFMTLRPGDLVLTGTPSGVGELKVGDEVEVSIEGIGSLLNVVERRA